MTIDTRTYDDGGRMLTSNYNNGVGETRAYNNDNTLSSISFTGAPIGNLNYGWDDNKNKTSESITGTMSGYGFSVGANGYDTEDRLIAWNRNDNQLNQSWNLTAVGDWDDFTENGNVQDRTHGLTHEMLTVAGEAVTHDAKGNMTSIPAVLRPGNDPLSMTWDFDNRMSSADVDNDGNFDVSYTFDALGRRVARDDGTNNAVYVQVGQQTIADYVSGAAASSPTYTYCYASYIDEPVMRARGSDSLYFHRNQQFSVVALTDATGNVNERYVYNAYGKLSVFDGNGTARTSSAEVNRYAYTGREWDEKLELYHFRARMYDPNSGCFLSRDPIGFEGSKWNLSEFLYGSPLANVDPLGLRVPKPNAELQSRLDYTFQLTGNHTFVSDDVLGNPVCYVEFTYHEWVVEQHRYVELFSRIVLHQTPWFPAAVPYTLRTGRIVVDEQYCGSCPFEYEALNPITPAMLTAPNPGGMPAPIAPTPWQKIDLVHFRP